MYEDASTLAEDRRPHDLTRLWERLSPLETVSGTAEIQLDRFCILKGISKASLAAQDARIALRGGGPDTFLAFPGRVQYKGAELVTAIKYRHLETGRRMAEAGSIYLRANIIGNRHSLSWFVAEGETDAARLWDLIGEEAAIMVLPAGALTIRKNWFDYVPMGATLYLCHDNDEAGNRGATRIAHATGHTIRLRPPSEFKDWCAWPGVQEEFLFLVEKAKGQHFNEYETYQDLYQTALSEELDGRSPVRLGFGSLDADLHGISDGQVCGIAARTAVGKTWMLASIVDNVAAAGHGSLICSLEMPGVEWFQRHWAIYDDVPPEQIEVRLKSEHEAPVDFFKKMKHTLVFSKALDLDELEFRISNVKNHLTVPLRCVYVDYLGLLGSRGRDIYERTSAIGKGLKQIAKQERVAIIIAMQLNRSAGIGSAEVTMEQIRDSGVIEESMDFLIGCWRPELKEEGRLNHEEGWRNVICAKILKNRKGKDGRTVHLEFHQPSMKVVELVR